MERLRVRGPDGKPHKETFVAVRYNKAYVDLKGEKTGQEITVHCTQIIRKGEGMVTKKAIVGVPFDFKKTKGERWSKTMKFDHKGVKAEAHVLVDTAGKTYTAFNTYNGSLGRRGKLGTRFKFKDYAQLAIRLQERGYSRVMKVKAPKPVVKAPPPPTPPLVVTEAPPVVVPKPE